MTDNPEIDEYGIKRWFNENGELHRLDGPAVIGHGYESWYVNGKRHRDNGPAVSIVYEDGVLCQEWYINNLLHRLDGPAIIDEYGPAWYVNDNKIECSSQEEFKKLLKLKAFW